MSSIHPPEFSLADNLGQHLACAESLQRLMAEEKAALLANDLEGLERLCTAKAAAAQTLQALSLRLNQHCRCNDAAGVEQFIRNGGNRAALQYWQDLMALAAHCQQANLENGALLLERQLRVRSMLQLMQRDERPLYGRSGASPLPAGRRALATA